MVISYLDWIVTVFMFFVFCFILILHTPPPKVKWVAPMLYITIDEFGVFDYIWLISYIALVIFFIGFVYKSLQVSQVKWIIWRLLEISFAGIIMPNYDFQFGIAHIIMPHSEFAWICIIYYEYTFYIYIFLLGWSLCNG